MKRQPYVAGYFYPDEPGLLRKTIESFVPLRTNKTRAYGAISPHAGYEYSGPVAAAVYSSVDIPADVVILGPAIILSNLSWLWMIVTAGRLRWVRFQLIRP